MKGISVLLFFAVLWPVAVLAGAEDLTAEEAQAKAERGDLLLIDVRSPQEWRQTGIPASAVPVTIHQAGGAQAFYKAILDVVDGDPSRPIAVICARGNRSIKAFQFLKAQGFTAVSNVGEGMFGNGKAPGWLARGLPTKPCQSC